jgi:hypothetical protein
MGVLEKALRQAIAARKESRYATAKGSGVKYTTLARFLDREADVRFSIIEKLAAYLALELRPKSRRG